MKNYIITAFLIFIVKFNGISQDLNKDMQAVMQNMIPPRGCSSYTMTLQYQKQLTSGDSSEALHGEYKFSGNTYLIRMNGVESYQDDKLLVSVNAGENTMIVNRPERIVNMDFNYLLLDSVLKNLNYNISSTKKSNELVYTIRLSSEEEVIDSIVIRIDKNKMIYRQVLVCFKKDFRISEDYEPAQYLIIDYYNYSFKNAPGDYNREFDTSKFVTIRDNKIIPAKGYVNYHIVNNLAGPVELD